MSELRIAVERWTGGGHATPEEAATRGILCIRVGDESLTRHEDTWSQSTGDGVHVPMYPMAVWMVANWWRLAFEPSRWISRPAYEWRASHELRAIGHGYLWPKVTIESDGEFVALRAEPTPAASKEPIRYLSATTRTVPLADFQQQLRQFVDTVVARLHAKEIRGSTLEQLWSSTKNDMEQTATVLTRRREARVGRDPCEADPASLAAIEELAAESGPESAEEIACAIPMEALRSTIAKLREATSSGIGRIARWSRDQHAGLVSQCQQIARVSVEPPRRRGLLAARVLRSAWGAGTDPLENPALEAQLGLDAGGLTPNGDADWLPAGLAVDHAHGVRLLLRSRGTRGRRFEAARLLGDLLTGPPVEPWHPATEARTARQKLQRVFAAELLCPEAGLRDFLGDDRTQEAMSRAADRYEVSEFVVDNQVKHLDRTGAGG